MTDERPVPAGYYPDPAVPGQRRWWDGTAWTSGIESRSDESRVPDTTPVVTAWFWLIVVLPLVSTVTLSTFDWAGYTRASFDPDPTAVVRYLASPGYLLVLAVGWLAYAANVVLAFLDWRALRRIGVARPFHWAWAFITSVYPIGRSIVVHRRTGRGLGALWLYIAVVVVCTVVVISVIIGGMITGLQDVDLGSLRR